MVGSKPCPQLIDKGLLQYGRKIFYSAGPGWEGTVVRINAKRLNVFKKYSFLSFHSVKKRLSELNILKIY
jgi:hypothetical protein